VDFHKNGNEDNALILAGFGRMGQRIGHIMDLMKVPYVAIDRNPSLVERERAKGKPVYYGDAQRPEVLRAAGTGDAPLVIVSIDDTDATEQVVSSLHTAFPSVPVFVRGHDMLMCHKLGELGAHITVSETLESSAELARAALIHLGVENLEVSIALEHFRKDYYERIEMGLHNKETDKDNESLR
jgi:voltage-gated potassium channel Kch